MHPKSKIYTLSFPETLPIEEYIEEALKSGFILQQLKVIHFGEEEWRTSDLHWPEWFKPVN